VLVQADAIACSRASHGNADALVEHGTADDHERQHRELDACPDLLFTLSSGAIDPAAEARGERQLAVELLVSPDGAAERAGDQGQVQRARGRSLRLARREDRRAVIQQRAQRLEIVSVRSRSPSELHPLMPSPMTLLKTPMALTGSTRASMPRMLRRGSGSMPAEST